MHLKKSEMIRLLADHVDFCLRKISKNPTDEQTKIKLKEALAQFNSLTTKNEKRSRN